MCESLCSCSHGDENIKWHFSFTHWADDDDFNGDEMVNLTYSKDWECVDIHDLHRYCKAFAVACGYSEQLVNEVFGEIEYS